MSTNKYLTSVLLGTAMTFNPAVSEAGGMSHIGRMGHMGAVGTVQSCKSASQNAGGSVHQPTMADNTKAYEPRSSIGLGSNLNTYNKIDVNKPSSITKNIEVNKPTSVIKNVDINKPISVSKRIDINKPVTVNKNVDINKAISINKDINNSKTINITNTIDDSKNVSINKNIVIQKGSEGGSSQADAQAEALAIASAVAAATSNSSSSATINVGGNVNASAFGSAFGYSGAGTSSGSSSYVAEAPLTLAGGEFGGLNVQATVESPAPAQCTFQNTTVIKAIHAICVSADHHEFPASHMVPDTWINGSYEGEVARCIAGSHLKVVIGKVVQSSEGLATGYTSGEVLECGLHEAVRHYKEGVLKCAPAAPVPDCTERTNLRRYGVGDMFFTYQAKICLETHAEYPITASIANDVDHTRPRGATGPSSGASY